MKIIWCKVGLHDWKHIRDAEYRDATAKRTAVPNHRARRVCRSCGKTQELEVHCLGLKPPKYMKNWESVSRVEHDLNGKAEILKDGAGALMVYDKASNTCFGLAPHNYLGPLEHQGNVTKVGKFALAYPK